MILYFTCSRLGTVIQLVIPLKDVFTRHRVDSLIETDTSLLRVVREQSLLEPVASCFLLSLFSSH